MLRAYVCCNLNKPHTAGICIRVSAILYGSSSRYMHLLSPHQHGSDGLLPQIPLIRSWVRGIWERGETMGLDEQRQTRAATRCGTSLTLLEQYVITVCHS
jgi:hypothetical protein